ncbi:MAG: hypothetical protein WBE20_03800 [Candidatus Acidiferrales bacterium]
MFLLLQGSLLPCLRAQQRPKENKTNTAELYTDADAYEIYAVLLGGEKGSSFVVQAQTDSWEKTTTDNLGIKGDSKFMKLWGTTLSDFVTKYRPPRILTKNIPLSAPYEIVPEVAINTILHEGGWNALSERYPLAHGFYTFSAVGFNPQRNRAIVWMLNQCGELCGGGTYHFFEKKDGKWREVPVHASVPMLAF